MHADCSETLPAERKRRRPRQVLRQVFGVLTFCFPVFCAFAIPALVYPKYAQYPQYSDSYIPHSTSDWVYDPTFPLFFEILFKYLENPLILGSGFLAMRAGFKLWRNPQRRLGLILAIVFFFIVIPCALLGWLDALMSPPGLVFRFQGPSG